MQFYKVKSVEETIQIIQREVQSISEILTIPIEEALHCVLAQDVLAKEDVPAFSRSTVDGYAVQAKDTYGSAESMPSFLDVTGEVIMGEEATTTLQSGQAMYIPTGGMLPPGSDSVIMIEYCEDIDGLLNTYKQIAPSENVIDAGEDVRKGSLLLPKGTVLRPQELGVLGSLGVRQIEVYRKVQVGYLSSGDEIVPYQTDRLAMGQVRDINQLTISTLAQEWGAEVIYGGIVRDQYEEFYQKAKELYDKVDLLVISGGSSVGAKDYTTEVIQSLGEPGIFVHGVSVKPGKPTIFGMAEGKPVLGLPGHPASAVVIFKLFGEEIHKCLRGELAQKRLERVKAKIRKNIPSSPGRADYIRVRLEEENGEWWAEPILGKSGLISTLVYSDGLVEIASEKEGVREGDWVPVILFR
jgi:molybdopterin molybdotransferase